jgi:site-specific DNA-methyltransferase (adenine-specific)
VKPGGYLLAFGGTRTYHRLAVTIEDAGFEIRDSILWLYGSGFPKSHDVSKAIDKAAGAERKVVARGTSGKTAIWSDGGMGNFDITAPVTPAAQQWSGWGTALKPAHEPIVVARKPLDGTVADNVLEWGVGAMNIDGCRVAGARGNGVWGSNNKFCQKGRTFNASPDGMQYKSEQHNLGRWPANVVLSHTIFCEQISEGEIVVSRVESQMPDMRGNNFGRSEKTLIRETNQYQDKPAIWKCADGCPVAELDRQTGQNASRFFYVAKASKRERPKVDDVAHPTVKPLALMRWLVRLVTPVGATVLEPFAGSGTTVEAALLEGCNILALEKNAEYLPLIQERMQRVNT